MDKRGLPPGWVWTTMGEIADSIRYGHTASANSEPVGPKFLRITDIQNRRVNWGTVPYCKCSEEEHEKYRLQPGDIVFARTGATTGKSFLISNCPDAVFASYLIQLRFSQELSVKYFALFFDSPLYWSQIMVVRKGSAQPGVNASILSDLQVPLPSLPEQQRIVDEIEAQFTRLDVVVTALKRAQATLKRYRASVLKTACEGRLVPQDPTDEPASQLLECIIAERRKQWNSRGPYIEPTPPDTSDLPELPVGWVWARWEQLSSRVTVGFVGPMKHEYVEDGIKFLRSQNVQENCFDPEGLQYISPEFHKRISKSTLNAGDLVVVRSGSVGVTCVIPEELGEANCSDLVIIKKPHGMVPAFGSFYMNSLAKRRVREGQVGVALIHFNTKSVADLPVPLPPLPEQQRIVEEVERRLSVMDEVEATLEANLKRAERLRQSILKRAFEGKLVPQNPADEPASALLERIRVAKAKGKESRQMGLPGV